MKKVAFVTASSSGIGKSIVQQLQKKGYSVYANGTDIAKLEKQFNNFVLGDMSTELNIKNAIEQIVSKENRLDLVVANLGSGKSILGWDVDINEHKKIFDINFFSSVILATKSIPYLEKTKGNIIFISSIAGCESIGAPIAYSSAKSALLSFAKSLSKEIAKLNIRVNTISPGNVMFENSTWDKKMQENKHDTEEYIQKNVPLNRFATPNDIAKAVLFLEKSDFITGCNIIIDGGQINKII